MSKKASTVACKFPAPQPSGKTHTAGDDLIGLFFGEFPKMVPSNHPVMDHDLVLKPMDTYGPMGIPHFKKPPIPLCHGGPVFLMERSATGSAQPKQ